jgi:hypothetical protein
LGLVRILAMTIICQCNFCYALYHAIQIDSSRREERGRERRRGRRDKEELRRRRDRKGRRRREIQDQCRMFPISHTRPCTDR